MLQFALHPLSSILLCCTTLTDFILLILKCEMPFLLINILDLFVHGRPCVSCFPYFVSVPKWTLHVLGSFVFVFSDSGSIYYIGNTCNLLQAVVHPLLGPGIRSIFFQEENYNIFWLSLFVIVNIDIGKHVQMFSCIFINYSFLVFCSFCMIKTCK